ncbi:MAG: cupredoxin domain-containing protein [Solirubrobacterales bacterium]|nr:cupredoxin domain-containing protein [Solirubrobacterales bacterium]
MLACAASPASANNTRVTIADFQWSNKTPHVDLGESVTWTWTGPDTQHSVTGQEPNATQWDSDPDTSFPNHQPGSEYKVTFDHPGTYEFVCKVHTSVRGTVTVSDNPGDPNSDPGPAPPINFDTEPPTLDGNQFTKDGTNAAPPFIGPKGKGIGYMFSLSEGGSASVDYYRLVKRGKGRHTRTIRRFQGYNEWETHVGLNLVRFAARSKTFKPVPGSYIAFFRAEDKVYNSTPDITLRFTIFPPKKKRR